jgi:hypothetical protein
MSQDRSLTSSQQQVLALIAAGSTARAAAETAGVHRNTVANWLCLSDFRQAIAHAQYDKALFFREQAESLAADAHNAIRAMLADPAVPANVRLKAALAMIDRATAALPPPPGEPPAPILDIEKHKNAQIQSEPKSPPATPDPPRPAASPALTPSSIQSEPKSPPATPDPPQPAASPAPAPSSGSRIGRNEACPCGSGMKFKRCCLGKTATRLSAAQPAC